MEFPKEALKGDKLNVYFYNSIDYHLKIFIEKLAIYEPESLFTNWRKLIRCIDEIINIPMELDDPSTFRQFLLYKDINSTGNSLMQRNLEKGLTENLDANVSARFFQFISICTDLHIQLSRKHYYESFGNQLDLGNTNNIICYFQSRRLYFLTTLFMIPKIAKGTKKCKFSDLLVEFFEVVDSCLVNVTTSFQKILLNSSISEYEMKFDQIRKIGIGNYNFDQLEDFFLNPQRLSLLDQLEFRNEEILDFEHLSKSRNKIFSFSEVANSMSLMLSAYAKYKISDISIFHSLNSFFVAISPYIIEDYDIIIDAKSFNLIQSDFPNLKLYNYSADYFENLNSISPFQKCKDEYYTTVVLLLRYSYNLITNSLLSNRRFQINSGFVFEEKVSAVLEKNGFKDLKITRIGRKEFDVVAVKNKEFDIEATKGDKIYNFQCKNNYYDITSVSSNPKILIGLNRRLCNYYEKALVKEKNREKLLTDTIGIDAIDHFVVSRFPVITKNPKILNYNVFEQKLKNL